jgi:hypothetical protein
MTPDAYYDNRLHEMQERDHRMELHEAAREEAIADMVQQLVNGDTVRVRTDRWLDAQDVHDEIDPQELRREMLAPHPCVHMVWRKYAAQLCARHVDDYMEWNSV